MKGISVTLSKAQRENAMASKFFGNPVFPGEWFGTDYFDDEKAFMCQINLKDIAPFDTDNLLPHEGYLYFFIDPRDYTRSFKVRYYEGEPDEVYESYNFDRQGNVDDDIMTEYRMTFKKEEEERTDGAKLLGLPHIMEHKVLLDGEKLLFQFDPLASDMEFLDDVGGLLYFIIDDVDLKNRNFDNVKLVLMRS